MRLIATDVTVPGPSPQHDPLLPPTSLVAEPGEVTLVPVGPEGSAREATALALALGGAVRLGGGSVDLWGESDPHVLRRHVVLVDVEGVTAPEDALPATAVVREQLVLARRPSRGTAARRVLLEHGVADGSVRWDTLDPGDRTAILLDVAARRPDAQVLVLAGPDRHGGDPRRWYAAARAQADTVLTVVVLCRPDTIAALAGPVTPTATTATTASIEEVPA
ncbi:hypothetical protein [Lapillicoccus jejuensis]|uniref:ABC transporter ATP-binding protein n=1 Tax=Lapillicoccus jejuensis TaxID=402171 RepID=A0A542E313_9MICO|nr:hypothetical protein [Lapillicoccus jejuensis]TQJ09717.1 hypothetical protein FB458_2831 [Lapillicoccus jejuensis]